MCMDIIKKHGTCVIAKSDMLSAFRNLGIRPSQFCYLVMKARSPLDRKWYYIVDKCLPFGASISCSHFQRVSNAIAFIVARVNKHNSINYLDDYLFGAYIRALCDAQVQAFLDICDQICFPVSLEKTFWATTLLSFLGLLIDTVHQYMCIPVDKVQRAISLVDEMISCKKTTVLKLQRLCRFLNFLCRCIVPG